MKAITSILAVILFTILSFTAGSNSTFAVPRFYIGYGIPNVTAEQVVYKRVWVKGHYSRNKFGKLVWVPGHWKNI